MKIFQKWVSIRYASPSNQLLVNGLLSTSIPLYRGTRQECPQSPLLFAAAIKTLAFRFPLLKGISLCDRTDTIGLCADDLILYLQDNIASLRLAMQIIDDYGTYSGLEINWQKSAQMPLCPQISSIGEAAGPLKRAPSFK